MNNYFSHDSNARNSDKLIPLRMKLGAEGYGIYFMLLERLREEPDYTSVKDYNMLAFDLRVGSDKVKSVVEDFGLFVFTEDGKHFYSEGFKTRMEAKDAKSVKARVSASLRWVKEKEECERNANASVEECERNANAQKNDAIKERKEKKRKEKESKEEKEIIARERATLPKSIDFSKRKEKFKDELAPFVETYGREMLNAFFAYWTEPNKSKTKMRFEIERTWDTSRRLATWAARQKDFTGGNNKQGGAGQWLSYFEASKQWSAADPQSNWICDPQTKLWRRK